MNGKTRKHIDSAILADAIKKHEKRERRREQFRRASKRKREKKKQTLALSTRVPQTVLEHLSSGEFPAFRPIEAMGKLGLTNEQMAEVLGVDKSTFNRWIAISPSLRASLLRGRKVADTHVADSLYHQAIGFSVPEEKIFYDSKRGKVVRTETEHYYPPNVVAGVFWLKNRFNMFWRDHKGEEQGVSSPANVQQVKFVIVGSPVGNGPSGSEKIIDGNYQILQTKPISSHDIAPDGDL